MGLVNSGAVAEAAAWGAVSSAYKAGRKSRSWHGAAAGAFAGACAAGTKKYLEEREEDKRADELPEPDALPLEEPPDLP